MLQAEVVAVFAIKLNGLFDNLTQFLKDRFFVVAAGPAVYQ